MTRYAPIRRTAIKGRSRKAKPGDDPEYCTFIRSLPCLICHLPLYIQGIIAEWLTADLLHMQGTQGSQQESRTECAHVGERGLKQKCPDIETIPLCGVEHHRLGKESHHVLGKVFWLHHGIKRSEIFEMLQEMYQRQV